VQAVALAYEPVSVGSALQSATAPGNRTHCRSQAAPARACRRRYSTRAPASRALAEAGAEASLGAPPDEIHYFQHPIRRQFRFATERQSDSSRVLAERSAGCKHERSRCGGNAVVVIPASGSDDQRQRRPRLPDLRGAGVPQLAGIRADLEAVGLPVADESGCTEAVTAVGVKRQCGRAPQAAAREPARRRHVAPSLPMQISDCAHLRAGLGFGESCASGTTAFAMQTPLEWTTTLATCGSPCCFRLSR